MDSTQRLAKDPQLVTRDIAGETLVVPVRANVGDLNSIYSLNPTASFIWELVDGERSVAQIVSALQQAFDVEAEEARQDTLELLEQLESAGLLVRVAAQQG